MCERPSQSRNTWEKQDRETEKDRQRKQKSDLWWPGPVKGLGIWDDVVACEGSLKAGWGRAQIQHKCLCPRQCHQFDCCGLVTGKREGDFRFPSFSRLVIWVHSHFHMGFRTISPFLGKNSQLKFFLFHFFKCVCAFFHVYGYTCMWKLDINVRNHPLFHLVLWEQNSSTKPKTCQYVWSC